MKQATFKLTDLEQPAFIIFSHVYGVAERSSDLSCAWLVSAVPVHVTWMNKRMESLKNC